MRALHGPLDNCPSISSLQGELQVHTECEGGLRSPTACPLVLLSSSTSTSLMALTEFAMAAADELQYVGYTYFGRYRKTPSRQWGERERERRMS